MLALSTEAFSSLDGNALTEERPTIKEFFDESEQGWFWYEVNEKGEKRKIYEPSKETKQPTTIPKEKKGKVKPEDQELSQAWFRKNFPKYRDNAIENPTDKEAMRTYLYLEKFMRERALLFAYERQAAVFSDPFLDATANRATASFGAKTMNLDAANNRKEMLSNLGDKSGIYFFYRSDCPYCKQQMPLIKLLEDSYGFSITPVALDHKPLPDSPWDSYINNVDQAEKFGVIKVPAMYLYSPENQRIELIAQGLHSLTQLEQRILYSANRVGLLSDDDMKKTRSSALYQDVDGDVGVPISAPDDSPEEFKKLFNNSLQHLNKEKGDFPYEQ